VTFSPVPRPEDAKKLKDVDDDGHEVINPLWGTHSDPGTKKADGSQPQD